jgi:serine/threonine protein kinase
MAYPKRIGRFEIQDLIGSSPDSKVFRAQDPEQATPAAVKALSLGDPRFKARFITAIDGWKRLSMKGVAVVLDSGASERAGWVATEPIRGRSLKHLIEERVQSGGTFAPEEILHIGRGVAEILLLCHVEGFPHGNLKPSNVFASLDGHIILTDFGMSRAITMEEVQARTVPPGTFRHLSPEQLAGVDATDEKSDAYQLGLILYEMVTLIHPFAGVEKAEDLDEGKRARVAPPEGPTAMPVRALEIIERCTSPDRDDRPETMRAFLSGWLPPAAAGPVPRTPPRTEFVVPPPAEPDFVREELPRSEPEAHPSAGSIFDEVPPPPEESGLEEDDHARPYKRTVKGPRELDDIYQHAEESDLTSADPRPSAPARRSSGTNRSLTDTPPKKGLSKKAQLAALVVLLLIVVAGGFLLYRQVGEIQLEGDVEQEVRLSSTVLSYRTNQPCETAVRVAGGGLSGKRSNEKDGQTRAHRLEITGLKAGGKYLGTVELPGKEGDKFTIQAPSAKPIGKAKLIFAGPRVRLSFKTTAKVHAVVRAQMGARTVEGKESGEGERDHEVELDGSDTAHLTAIAVELKDASGTTVSLKLSESAWQALAALIAKSPPTGPRGELEASFE